MPPSETRTNFRPIEFAMDRASDVLPDPGRAEEAQNRALDVRIELAHGEVLQHAILDLLEARMVRVEDLLGVLQIDRARRCACSTAARPASRRRCATPCTRRPPTGIFDSRSSSRSASFFTAVGHAGRVDLGAQLLDFLGLLVPFAELLLDRLHLLAQEVLALVLADLGLHLRLDVRPELEDLELLDEDPVQRVHPRAHVERRQNLLLDRRADGREARGDEVGELARDR